MELELTPDQQALAEAVRELLDAQCPMSMVRRLVEQAEGADKDVAALWDRMVELDWPSLVVPEACGGVGLGAVELAVVAEEMGRTLCPAPLLSTAAQFVPAVAEAGTPEQLTKFLGAVAAKELRGTLAVAEESGRWSTEDVATTATPLPGDAGGRWVLRGRKDVVFDAVGAQEIVVAARVARDTGAGSSGGIGLFVVPGDAVQVRPMRSVDATRSLATVELADVEVDDERLLGGPGAVGETSERALARAVQTATAALSAEMVGTSQAIFDIVHAYVGEREQFGVKIGSFQAVKHKLANMFVALESARATAYFAAAAVAEDDERRGLAVAMAKSSAGDCQKLMGTEGIQCLGGIGYTWEHDMHLYVKRQKAQAAVFGTAAEHRAFISARLGL